MTKDELIQRLREIQSSFSDIELAHIEADKALLEYIDDPEIAEAFNAIEKWYA